jgi:hypothetical protein
MFADYCVEQDRLVLFEREKGLGIETTLWFYFHEI